MILLACCTKVHTITTAIVNTIESNFVLAGNVFYTADAIVLFKPG